MATSVERLDIKVDQQGYYIFEEIYRNLKEHFELDIEGLYPIYEAYGRNGFHDYLCRKAEEYDIIFFQFTSKPFYDFNCFLRIKEANPAVKIVTFHGDDALLFPSYTAALLDGIDLVVIIDAPEIALAHCFLGRRAAYLPGFVPGRVFRDLGLEKDIPVSFAGGAKQDRMEMISFAKDKHIPIQAFGKGTESGFLETEQYIDVINRSKINLVFTKAGWNSPNPRMFPKGYRIPSQFKGHIAEILLCGSFALVEHFEGLEADLIPGKEIAIFEGPEDLVEKTRYYLHHDDEREAIASAGFEKAKRRFESRSQVERIVKVLSNGADQDETLPHNSPESLPTHLGEWKISRKIKTTPFVEWHLIMGLQFLRRRQLGCATEEFMVLRYGLPSTDIFSKIYSLGKKYFSR